MLNIEATNDKELLDELSSKIFGLDFNGAVGYVMNCDNQPIGVAKVDITGDKSIIKSVGIVPREQHQGYGDFFTRVLMDNLTRVTKKVQIAYLSDYYLKFGFKKNKDIMEIDSDNIVFPSKCKHNS